MKILDSTFKISLLIKKNLDGEESQWRNIKKHQRTLITVSEKQWNQISYRSPKISAQLVSD